MTNHNLANLSAAVTLVLFAFYANPAAATKPMLSHRVVGCVLGGQFVPYSNQTNYTSIQKLPYWVRKLGGQKAEGKEIRLVYSDTCMGCKEVPNFLLESTVHSAQMEVIGLCDRSRLVIPAPKP